MSELSRYFRLKKVWVYSEPIDFRKQINGLVDLVLSQLEKEPSNGDLYVFRNRQSNRLKLLVWDRNGYVMGYKRLEKGKFDFPCVSGAIRFKMDELISLISGMPMVHFSGIKKVIYTH